MYINKYYQVLSTMKLNTHSYFNNSNHFLIKYTLYVITHKVFSKQCRKKKKTLPGLMKSDVHVQGRAGMRASFNTSNSDPQVTLDSKQIRIETLSLYISFGRSSESLILSKEEKNQIVILKYHAYK